MAGLRSDRASASACRRWTTGGILDQPEECRRNFGSRDEASGRTCPVRCRLAASPAAPATSCAGLGSMGKAETRCLVGNERRRAAAVDAPAPAAFRRGRRGKPRAWRSLAQAPRLQDWPWQGAEETAYWRRSSVPSARRRTLPSTAKRMASGGPLSKARCRRPLLAFQRPLNSLALALRVQVFWSRTRTTA